MSFTIRPASPEDGLALQEIERSAGQAFAEVGMADIAEDDPPSLDVLAGYAQDGRSWVAVDDAGDPVGYILVDVVDGNAHVEQVSVSPAVQGTGIGRALIAHVAAWAHAADMSAITLTTFRGVPWNAPLYRHMGFRELRDDEIGPGLRAVRDAEAAHGLDPNARVCMSFEIVP